jgi:hypothetical protein
VAFPVSWAGDLSLCQTAENAVPPSDSAVGGRVPDRDPLSYRRAGEQVLAGLSPEKRDLRRTRRFRS